MIPAGGRRHRRRRERLDGVIHQHLSIPAPRPAHHPRSHQARPPLPCKSVPGGPRGRSWARGRPDGARAVALDASKQRRRDAAQRAPPRASPPSAHPCTGGPRAAQLSSSSRASLKRGSEDHGGALGSRRPRAPRADSARVLTARAPARCRAEVKKIASEERRVAATGLGAARPRARASGQRGGRRPPRAAHGIGHGRGRLQLYQRNTPGEPPSRATRCGRDGGRVQGPGSPLCFLSAAAHPLPRAHPASAICERGGTSTDRSFSSPSTVVTRAEDPGHVIGGRRRGPSRSPPRTQCARSAGFTHISAFCAGSSRQSSLSRSRICDRHMSRASEALPQGPPHPPHRTAPRLASTIDRRRRRASRVAAAARVLVPHGARTRGAACLAPSQSSSAPNTSSRASIGAPH